ncbi:Septin-domain-containing protein [Zychaea mexicana]|uniref:Septin-domain-containing protein n=1 Tax=Zychaea mexicana TaxID=64656 RepID=UPI0022FE6211|nr:Septin-domain-containing protein [Zychaea mexicana]KAI9488845.1 Septin-domain-containing protein [Zychaea mexicana]
MPLEHALQTRGLFPDLGPYKHAPARAAPLNRPLGMDQLPRQRHLKTKRTPFRLNIMVVGETGLGKSTFMNTLFCTDLNDTSVPKVPQDTKTVEITPIHFELEEEGVNLNLCLVDTPGFGDRLNRTDDVQPILEYIDKQYALYYEAERSSEFRRGIVDTRIHACLYFIAPTGHSLKDLDIETLKELSTQVTVIPVIAKGDTMTQEEKLQFKKTILEDLEYHNIPVYPSAYPDDDRDDVQELVQHIPFAVMGSDSIVDLPNGKKVRGRAYRWGTVEVENPEHCDMVHLRQLIMIQCLHELSDLSHDHHYHGYRTRLLRSQGRTDSFMKCDENYDEQMEQLKNENDQAMSQREEEIRQQFVQLVQTTEDDLRRREQELQEKRDKMMSDLEEQQRQIAQLEQELN